MSSAASTMSGKASPLDERASRLNIIGPLRDSVDVLPDDGGSPPESIDRGMKILDRMLKSIDAGMSIIDDSRRRRTRAPQSPGSLAPVVATAPSVIATVPRVADAGRQHRALGVGIGAQRRWDTPRNPAQAQRRAGTH
jgi:hypothetical protein